jgi:lipopolysaccharide/colanic/teichoic acid biosynthesis glycosyltransferase
VDKTAFDKLAAASALVLLAPLLLAIAAAVWLEDGEPVLARQSRIGRRRRPFHRYAFRIAAADSGRLTQTGAWLYRWCLQRIPQLVNVLAGQMSPVGPRPAGPAKACGTAITCGAGLTHRRGRVPHRPPVPQPRRPQRGHQRCLADQLLCCSV